MSDLEALRAEEASLGRFLLGWLLIVALCASAPMCGDVPHEGGPDGSMEVGQ